MTNPKNPIITVIKKPKPTFCEMLLSIFSIIYGILSTECSGTVKVLPVSKSLT